MITNKRFEANSNQQEYENSPEWVIGFLIMVKQGAAGGGESLVCGAMAGAKFSGPQIDLTLERIARL